jgi:regulator of Ty1 transposition protein 103
VLQVNIWDDRKLFGTQGQLLKEEYTRKFKELKSVSNMNDCFDIHIIHVCLLSVPCTTYYGSTYLQKKPGGELMEKVISSYKHMLRAPIDEDKLMRKCNSALSFVDNLNKEYGNSYLGKIYIYRHGFSTILSNIVS